MRTACLSSILVMVISTIAFAGGDEEGPFYDAVMYLKDAFNEEGRFDTDARENLLAANDLLTEIKSGLNEDSVDELIAVMSLKSLAMYNLACLDALEGDTEGALVWLDGAVSSGYTDAEWMSEDPDLDPLHDDPRFDDLLERAYDIETQFELDWTSPSGSCECECEGGHVCTEEEEHTCTTSGGCSGH